MALPVHEFATLPDIDAAEFLLVAADYEPIPRLSSIPCSEEAAALMTCVTTVDSGPGADAGV